MKLLVTGDNGQVGFELQRALSPLGTVVSTNRASFDLSRPETLRAVLDTVRPDVIVNAAAYTAVDRAEDEEAVATAVNATSVAELGSWAIKNSALLVHYSTDYVFDGSNTSPYVEDDPTNPINAYGRSKLAGERALAELSPAYLCLRTSWVYATRGNNFLLTMLRLAMEREGLRIVGDQVGVPNFARTLADATASLVAKATQRISESSFERGVYNLSGSGSCSWFEFANEIFSQARSTMPLAITTTTSIPTSDYPTPARRPAYSVLSPSALDRDWGVTLPSWQEMLSEAITLLPAPT